MASKNQTNVAVENIVDFEMVKMHLFAFVGYLIVAVLAGLSYSLQFLQKYPFPGVELLRPGRIRMIHTNSVAFGMLANGLVGCLYYVIPKLTDRQVLSKWLSRFCFYVYNSLVHLTVALISAGYAQGLEWAETPAILDPFIAIAVVVLFINLGTPIWRAREKTFYVSLWYILAAFIWTPIVYVFGNFLP